MSINKYNIKKWFKMMFGKSILHVNQNVGQLYDKNTIAGYYNDLSEKVLKSNLSSNQLPKTELSNGKIIEFPIAIFQYGLGAYDLYLKTNNDDYYNRFMLAVEWAVTNQKEHGEWISFEYESKSNPYSSMTQGEGVSLLLRAYFKTKKNIYFESARNAIDFMLKDVNDGGCTLYENNEIIFKEFPERPIVLNGWIFSLFGLYDYYLVSNDIEIKKIFNNSIISMLKLLPKFDNGYWSRYDIDKKIASPFYHKLHISLLRVMYILTNEDQFQIYANKFEKYDNKKINKFKAFFKKAFQKIFER